MSENDARKMTAGDAWGPESFAPAPCEPHHFVWTWPIEGGHGSVGVCDLCRALTTGERDALQRAEAWDEGFKQGGPMHDENYDDPDAHTRNPYRAAKPWCLCDPGIGPHDADCPYRAATEAGEGRG